MLNWIRRTWRSLWPIGQHGDAAPSETSPAEPSYKGRKFLQIVAAVLVCVYLVTVFIYGEAVPDIGLTCIFSTQILRDSAVQVPIPPGEPDRDYKGYHIEQVGEYPIYTWPDFLRSLRTLNRNAAVDVADPAVFVPGQTHRRANGEEQVLVRLRGPGQREPTLVWCRVDRSASESLLPSVLWFGLKGGLFLVSLLVFWKRPNDRSAAQFFLLSIVTVGAFMGGYHWWRILPWPPLILVFAASGVFLPAVNLHFYLLFPRPKPVLHSHPVWTLGLIYGVPAFFLAMITNSYFQVRWLVDHSGTGPEATKLVEHALGTTLGWILLYFTVAGTWYVGSVVCLVHSWRTASDLTERNQVKCILFGSLLALVPISFSLYVAIFDRESFGSGAATWPMFAASLCFTAAYAVSITRYRLMQLDQIFTSGVVYFVISFLAGLAYYLVVFVAMLFVGRGTVGPSLSYALTASTTALVLAFVLDQARSRFKKALDRRFRRDKVHLDRTLQQMGQAIEQLVDPPTLARRLLGASAELLGVSRGSIYLRESEPGLYRLAESLGEPPSLSELASGCPLVDSLAERPLLTVRHHPWVVGDSAQTQLRFLGAEVAQALAHEGRLLALLILGPKESGPYTAEDFNLLAAFAQITALALENAERHRTIESLNRDLHGKVEKISEQQRRIIALQSQLGKNDAETRRHGDTANGKTDDVAASPRPAIAAPGDGAIVGSSPTIRQLLQLIRKVAQSPSAVLLRGESGTGKELLAQALHDNSPRAGKTFVKVHCAALSPGLLESELFGHVKGAFTGAHRDKIGRFELANGGTLFLDEIGDISLEVQTKLLRVLQEMKFERVGSSEPVEVDVRIIAATHQDLESLIAQGRFRKDLYYRLNVISIQVPPLRERPEDIPELAMHFLRIYAQRANQPVRSIDDDALAAMKGCAWPGNIRQLENVIERAVVVAVEPTITLNELPPELFAPASETNGSAPPRPVRDRRPTPTRSRQEDREQREKELLVRALAAAAGNKAEAARTLGLARSTLLSKLKKFGLS